MYVPYKNAQEQKKAQHRSYLRNRDRILANQKERREDINRNALERRRDRCRWVNQQKSNVPCTSCGRCFPPWAMDYHHVRGVKIRGVRDMVNLGYSKTKIADEIAKCDLLCAICHRAAHCEPEWSW